ncbi:helix-turn-helix transcriptional regulator [Acidovorax sp. BLS4]|uniref:helix-turn-helix domain-containing protein n=1 Tax=Acidovorax sp. BLS4 TaxID=3273430 RepID=UPI002941DD87|nr:helix-turn-helix transcriptional regulator [Paracidovorax avenae]WOI46510.1 helix-turn-helix transcriptional regulator [Paracidovorax avenae]
MPTQSPSTPAKKRRVEFDPRKSLGLRIKELRVEHGLTQEELSDRSGLFRTYMSRIESGQANPTLTMLHQIAGAFAIDVRDLLTLPQNQRPTRVRATATVSRGRVNK